MSSSKEQLWFVEELQLREDCYHITCSGVPGNVASRLVPRPPSSTLSLLAGNKAILANTASRNSARRGQLEHGSQWSHDLTSQ